MEDAWLAVHGEPLAPVPTPTPVTGWRLTLRIDDKAFERHGFAGGEAAYAEAQTPAARDYGCMAATASMRSPLAPRKLHGAWRGDHDHHETFS